MALESGQLKHQLTIKIPRYTRANEQGEVFKSYSTFATVWASVEPVSGREAEYARQFAATVSHKIKIRYRPNVQTTLIGCYGSRTFYFNAVLDDQERHEFLTIYATEQLSPVIAAAPTWNVLGESDWNSLDEVTYNYLGE